MLLSSARPRLRVLACLLTALCAGSAAAQDCATYNVTADWSDASNPNDTWSYLAGDEALSHVDAWQRISGGWTRFQQGWALSEDGDDRAPFWFRSNGTETFEHDYERCDVAVHTTNQTEGVGAATLQWTAPSDTTVSIRGGVWMARDIGRSNDWMLYKNDQLLSQGSIASGDAYTRDAPFLFIDGSGDESAVTDIELDAGDTIRLELLRTSQFGDVVGVKLRIVCEPTGTSTTTTTMVYADCGDPLGSSSAEASSPAVINASDALYTLRSAVGTASCEPCVCDTNDSGTTTATDALAVLKFAVGLPTFLECPFCPCAGP